MLLLALALIFWAASLGKENFPDEPDTEDLDPLEDAVPEEATIFEPGLFNWDIVTTIRITPPPPRPGTNDEQPTFSRTVEVHESWMTGLQYGPLDASENNSPPYVTGGSSGRVIKYRPQLGVFSPTTGSSSYWVHVASPQGGPGRLYERSDIAQNFRRISNGEPLRLPGEGVPSRRLPVRRAEPATLPQTLPSPATPEIQRLMPLRELSPLPDNRAAEATAGTAVQSTPSGSPLPRVTPLPLVLPLVPGALPALPQSAPVPLPLPLPTPTPTALELFTDGLPIPQTFPPPTIQGIANEVGKIEGKVMRIYEQTKVPALPDDLLPVFTRLLEFLSSFDDGGAYFLPQPCGVGSDGEPLPDLIVEIPATIGPASGTRARLDALAELMRLSKLTKQPICKGRAIGVPTTVTFEEGFD